MYEPIPNIWIEETNELRTKREDKNSKNSRPASCKIANFHLCLHYSHHPSDQINKRAHHIIFDECKKSKLQLFIYYSMLMNMEQLLVFFLLSFHFLRGKSALVLQGAKTTRKSKGMRLNARVIRKTCIFITACTY